MTTRTRTPRARAARAAWGLLAAAIATGCDRDDNEIHAYRAPKPPASAQAGGPSGGRSIEGAGASKREGSDAGRAQVAAPRERVEVSWDLPAGWTRLPGEQPMRIATFKAALNDAAHGAGANAGVEVSPQIEITLTAFPGDVGGLLANVNRWRGQIGLNEVAQADLPRLVSAVKVPSPAPGGVGEFQVVSLRHEADASAPGMLAAIVQPGDGQSWFVKAIGTPAQLDALRPSLERFAGSFKLGSAWASVPAPGASPAGAGDPMSVPGAPQVAPSRASGDVASRLASWQAPANWVRDAQASGVVAGAFNASNGAGGARVTATSLNGDGGGALSNINRWRQQLGLEPVASLEAQATTALGDGASRATLVDLVDAAGAQRMFAAIVPAPATAQAPAQTWFFKLTGASKAVDAERAAFESLVRVVGLGERE